MSSQLLITEQIAIPDTQSYSGDLGRQARDGTNLQVLIADNSKTALRTTREYFEIARFNIISVGSPQAAGLVIHFSAGTLDAIVLDGRLTDDDDDRDRSGYELAQETLAQVENPPPIVIYSRYDDRRQFALDWDRVIFVSKDEGREVLVEKVLEQINLRLSDNPRPATRLTHSPPPVVVLDTQGGGAADRLQAELTKAGLHARTCPGLSALLEAAPYLPSAMLIIDLDACERAEGVKAIRALKEAQDPAGRPLYVAVLAGSEELRHEAAQAGADVFLVKDSAETDALELVIRMAQHKMELERAAAAKPQTQLAARWYEELVRRLRELRESPARGMAAPMETVERALNWPFLSPQEQLVLTALYTQMLAVGVGAADTGTIDLCLEGATMLARDRAQGADVHEWVERATQHSPDFTLAWFKEEYLKEMFEDDGEQGDD
jgi:DNA-binding NarL/FixJ family response regulator